MQRLFRSPVLHVARRSVRAGQLSRILNEQGRTSCGPGSQMHCARRQTNRVEPPTFLTGQLADSLSRSSLTAGAGSWSCRMCGSRGLLLATKAPRSALLNCRQRPCCRRRQPRTECAAVHPRPTSCSPAQLLVSSPSSAHPPGFILPVRSPVRRLQPFSHHGRVLRRWRLR